MILTLLAGYFLCLYEYVVMRHLDICADSDRRINNEMQERIATERSETNSHWVTEALTAKWLYRSRGIK